MNDDRYYIKLRGEGRYLTGPNLTPPRHQEEAGDHMEHQSDGVTV